MGRRKKREASNDIHYSEVVEALLEAIPELLSDYHQEATKWPAQQVQAHVVYGSLFSDFVRRLVLEQESQQANYPTELIRCCFALLERLASSSDFQTRCMVETSVLESLLGQTKGDWKMFSRYFEPNTKQMALQLAERWNLKVA